MDEMDVIIHAGETKNVIIDPACVTFSVIYYECD